MKHMICNRKSLTKQQWIDIDEWIQMYDIIRKQYCDETTN